MVTAIQNQKVEKRKDSGLKKDARQIPEKEGLHTRWSGSAARQDPLFDTDYFMQPLERFEPKTNPVIPKKKYEFLSIDFFPSWFWPLSAAVLLSILVSIIWWNQPISYLRNFKYYAPLSLPQDDYSDRYILDFAKPMSDETLFLNLTNFDPKTLEPLHFTDYVVQAGDTLSDIALHYNLNIDTIISFNDITDPRRIRIGQTYKIPNRDGLKYKTQKGDTLEGIAKKFDVGQTVILDGNNLEDSAIQAGVDLFIPGARLNSTDLKILLGELFMWPMKNYRITEYFGWRIHPITHLRAKHIGIDITSYFRAPIYAASSGRVIAVETQVGNFGKFILIQHPRGFTTLYAHLDSFNVQVGQYVNQGQVIGRMGNTGLSTGPHLHFSVLKNGVYLNPLQYLP